MTTFYIMAAIGALGLFCAVGAVITINQTFSELEQEILQNGEHRRTIRSLEAKLHEEQEENARLWDSMLFVTEDEASLWEPF